MLDIPLREAAVVMASHRAKAAVAVMRGETPCHEGEAQPGPYAPITAAELAVLAAVQALVKAHDIDSSEWRESDAYDAVIAAGRAVLES